MAATLTSPPREHRRIPLGPSAILNSNAISAKPTFDGAASRTTAFCRSRAGGSNHTHNSSIQQYPNGSTQNTIQSPALTNDFFARGGLSGDSSAPFAPPTQTIHNPVHITTANPNPGFLSSRAVGAGKRYRGVVVYYTTTKGFGFAHTEKPEVWKIYVHIYALEKCGIADLEVGMELEFNVRENHKGKYACNVCPVTRDASGQITKKEISYAVPMLEGRHRGTLKSFDSQRLFGWVVCGDTEVFMTIYELRQDNMEQHLVPGTLLEFSIGKHGRGATAYDIDVLHTAAVAHPQLPRVSYTPVFGGGSGVGINFNSSAQSVASVTPVPTILGVPVPAPFAVANLAPNNTPVAIATPNNVVSGSNGANGPTEIPMMPTLDVLNSVAAMLQTGGQTFSQEQLNSLIAATIQSWQLPPNNAAPPAGPLNPTSTEQQQQMQPQSNVFSFTPQPRSNALIGGGIVSEEFLNNARMIGGEVTNAMPVTNTNEFTNDLSCALLRLPCAPAQSNSPLWGPILSSGFQSSAENGNTSLCVGWDEVTMNGRDGHSSLSNIIDRCADVFDPKLSSDFADFSSFWSSSLL